MKVTCASLLEGASRAEGVAVVVDVYRAFTCSPLMFSLGVESVILVGTVEEALSLKQKDAELILVGEVGGIPVDGFDLGNSPSQILKQPPGFFRGKRAVQRSSAGVQGVIAAMDAADEVLLGSYALAGATARYIASRRPNRVSIVAMGLELKERVPEDEWCSRYIAHLLGAGEYRHHEALRQIIFHETTQKFLRGDRSYFPAEDPILCLQRDTCTFGLRVRREKDLVVVRKATSQ